MYCLFCLLVSGRVAPKNPFSSRHEARAGSLAANKRAKGLARATPRVNTLLHAWVTPATVRALAHGELYSLHGRRSPTRPSRTTTSSSRTASTSPRSATWPTRVRSRTTSRRTRGSRARRAFPSCSRGTPTAAASPSPCSPKNTQSLKKFPHQHLPRLLIYHKGEHRRR